MVEFPRHGGQSVDAVNQARCGCLAEVARSTALIASARSLFALAAREQVENRSEVEPAFVRPDGPSIAIENPNVAIASTHAKAVALL